MTVLVIVLRVAVHMDLATVLSPRVEFGVCLARCGGDCLLLAASYVST